MNIILTEHVMTRMHERDFTIEDIKYVLEAHDFSVPSKKGGTELWRRFPDGRELKVWIAQQIPLPKRVIIKSAGWGGSMSKYKLTVDADASAAYFYVDDLKVSKTVEVNDSVLVDLDSEGRTVGVEFLSLLTLSSFSADTLNDFLTPEDSAELVRLLEKPLRSYLMTNRLVLH